MKHAWIAAALSVALGCSSGDADGGSGSVAFSTWGEAYIEQGIPAEEFEDGWSVTFQKFLIVIKDVKVEGAGAIAGGRVFDMVKPGVKTVGRLDGIAAKPWPRVSFQIGPIAADDALGEGATEADKALLVSAGASVHDEGTATKGGTSKTFSWTFAVPTLYDRCEGDKDGKTTEGVIVTNGGTDEVQLTIHGDHFFYDDLQASTAKLRFDAIARADADGDGAITLDELAAVRLATIPKEKGPFGTGSAANVNTLRDFVTALSRTLGHYRGEGECHARDVPG